MLYTYLFILLTSSCFIHSNGQGTIFIVHGAFAQNEPWYQPDGDFFKILAQEALTQNYTLESFTWSGIPEYTEVSNAAKKLAQKIIQKAHNKIILIGHSFGGNVIALTTNILASINTTKQQTTSHSAIAILNNIVYYTEMLKNLLYNQKDSTSSYEQPLIEHIFLLGTPIIPLLYKPSCETVGHIWNVYSLQDKVQRLGGISYRCLPAHTKVSNINLSLEHPDNNMPISPDHSELHNPLVALWLLQLPHNKTLKKNNHHELCFSTTQPPQLIADTAKRNLINTLKHLW